MVGPPRPDRCGEPDRGRCEDAYAAFPWVRQNAGERGPGDPVVDQLSSSRVTACGYLVDVYCLGVKNTTGPQAMSSGALIEHTRRFFSAFGEAPRAVPLEVAQHLVHGAVAYARSFGFEPHPEFADTAPYLGTPPGPCPIRFGRDGQPFYISGPDDNPRAVINALEATAGPGNYHYITHL